MRYKKRAYEAVNSEATATHKGRTLSVPEVQSNEYILVNSLLLKFISRKNNLRTVKMHIIEVTKCAKNATYLCIYLFMYLFVSEWVSDGVEWVSEWVMSEWWESEWVSKYK